MTIELQRPDLLRQACLLSNGWQEADTAKNKLEVRNPATGELIGFIPKLGYDETTAAIAAAAAARPAWSAKTAH